MKIHVKPRSVDAANIENVINEIEEEFLRAIKEIGYIGYTGNVWPIPIKKQVEKLSLMWSDPKSDGTGEIFYFEYEPEAGDESD